MRRLFLMLAVAVSFLLPQAVYAATTWFMPEGSTQGSFELYILVNNPSASSAEVKYTFYTDTETIALDSSNAPAGFTANCTITAGQRSTLNVNSLSGQTGFTGLSGKPISTKVESTNGVNIVAERAMYWDDSTMPWDAGTATRGVSGVEGCYIEIGQPATFPITISSSGSYKLISNINCTTQDVNAIEITADDVTVDLNGFTITGPGEATGSTGDGINVNNEALLYNTVIKDGSIKDFRGNGIYFDNAYEIKISNVTCENNGEFGCYLNANCYSGIIQNSIFYENGDADNADISGGLRLYYGMIVTNCVIRMNEAYGIYVAGLQNIIKGNIVAATKEGGVTEAGIYVTSTHNFIEGNHCMYNNTGDITFSASGTANLCINNAVSSAVTENVADDNEIGNADVTANANPVLPQI